MNDYVKSSEIRRQLGISPARVVTFLQDHKKDLPVVLHRESFAFCTDWSIREGCLVTPWSSDDSCATNKFYAEGKENWLPYLLVNRRDWDAYIANAEPDLAQPELVRHAALFRPIIFEDILKAWLGENKTAKLLKDYEHDISNKVVDLIREMENFLLDAAENSRISVYDRRESQGEEIFSVLNPFLPLPTYQPNKGIAEHFIFRLYHDCGDDILSKPIYFNADEVAQCCPFLKFAEDLPWRQSIIERPAPSRSEQAPLFAKETEAGRKDDMPFLTQTEKEVKQAAWEAAINSEKLEINNMDKPPRGARTRIIRLTNYLDVCLRNKTAFSIKAQDANIYRNLITAEKNDVPYMRAKYTALPDLPPRPKQIK